jgi:hypothetical protein
LNTPIVRAFTFQGTNVWNPVGYNAYLSFGEDANVTNMVVTTGTCYSTYIDFQIGSNTFAYPVTRWYCSVMVTKPAIAGTYSIAYGYLNIKAAPEVNANGSFFYTRAINGSEYGPFTGSFTNWPFVLSGTFLGGYVDIPTFNASNSAIQSQITANLTNQNASNTVIQVQVTANTTGKTDLVAFNASNSTIQAQVTANTTGKTDLVTYNAHAAAQANTNSLFQGLFSALAGTNSLFQGFFNSQTSTNSLFQGWFTALISTNGVFQGLFNAQVNTNSGFQSLFTNQAATNAVLQNLIVANQTNQVNTNIAFNLRIGSNETFRITTQPGTNAVLQNQITANYTNQNATNLNLQEQINSVSTNASMGLYRYDACPSVPNTIWVMATSTNIAALRAGSTFTFTIPSGTRLLSSKIRVDGGNTDSGSIYLVLGTNDMNNSSTVNNWIPVCNATRDDTYANIPVTAQTYSSDNTQIKISGLGAIGGIIYHVESRY